ncbi:MAG: dihydroneopterin aldolase [Syntrophothermus sp.]
MLNIIRLKKVTFYAYHGAFSEEQSLGGKFEADIDMFTSFTDAALNDDLSLTVNYDKVYKFIHNTVLERKYKLIETLAVRLADGILSGFPNVEKVAVRVRKYNVPVGGFIDHAEAEVIKDRSEL